MYLHMPSVLSGYEMSKIDQSYEQANNQVLLSLSLMWYFALFCHYHCQKCLSIRHVNYQCIYFKS